MLTSRATRRKNENLSRDAEGLKKAIRFVQYRPRSVNEVVVRMRSWGFEEDVIEKSVNALEESGLLNDHVFAESFMEEMLNKGYGLQKVQYELRKKGLSEEVLEETLSRYPLDKEEQRAIEVARKKVESLKEKNELEATRKIQSYLLRRGFSPSICARALENIGH